jgi:hypothetical protein
MSKKSFLYPVRKPRHLWRRWRKKCSFLVEGGVQNHAFSNGVYLLILMFLFFLGVQEGLSQPASTAEKGLEIRLGEVAVKIREFESAPSPFKILELQIEILNQSQQSVAPPNSIKVVVTPKEIKFSSTKSTGEFNPTPEETTLNLPLPPKTGRVLIIGYPFQTESPESIAFEIQINPPEGEKKTVTWEKH